MAPRIFAALVPLEPTRLNKLGIAATELFRHSAVLCSSDIHMRAGVSQNPLKLESQKD